MKYIDFKSSCKILEFIGVKSLKDYTDKVISMEEFQNRNNDPDYYLQVEKDGIYVVQWNGEFPRLAYKVHEVIENSIAKEIFKCQVNQ